MDSQQQKKKHTTYSSLIWEIEFHFLMTEWSTFIFLLLHRLLFPAENIASDISFASQKQIGKSLKLGSTMSSEKHVRIL